jgi:hypothetical protein
MSGAFGDDPFAERMNERFEEAMREKKANGHDDGGGSERTFKVYGEWELPLDDEPEYVVEDFIRKGEFIELDGGKGSGKSAVANYIGLDLAYCSVKPEEDEPPTLFGHKVILSGPILCIASEGGKRGMAKRRAA